ncbi:hypothetical protein AB7645_05535 [Bradyrhizobium sp. 956_D2_N1_5]
MDDTDEPAKDEESPKPSQAEELRRMIEKYIADQREIARRLIKPLAN